MKDALKNTLIALATVALGAIVLWLTGGLDKIAGWLHREAIKAVSTSRGEVAPFLAEEAIRFSLKNESSDKVVWDFEETDLQSGGVQIEHAFKFDPAKPRGIESVRRVDVFFRDGDRYKTATIHVPVINVQFASAKVEGNTIAFKSEQSIQNASDPLASRWLLCGVSIGKIENGSFQTDKPTSKDECAVNNTFTVDQAALKKVGVTFGPEFDPETAKWATAKLDFISSDGKHHVETLKNLDSQLVAIQRQMTTPNP